MFAHISFESQASPFAQSSFVPVVSLIIASQPLLSFLFVPKKYKNSIRFVLLNEQRVTRQSEKKMSYKQARLRKAGKFVNSGHQWGHIFQTNKFYITNVWLSLLIYLLFYA